MNIYPYVYRLTNKFTGQFYIGYRSANKVIAEEDLGIYYFSSSRSITNFEDFHSEVVAIFFEKNDAYDFEQQLIQEHWHDPLLINKSCFHEKGRFKLNNHTEASKQKISESRTGIIFSEQHRDNLKEAFKTKDLSYITDEYRAHQAEKSRNISDETRKKRSDSLKGKEKSPEHLSAISSALKGRTLSEEHKSKLRGRKFTEEHKQKLRDAKAKKKLLSNLS